MNRIGILIPRYLVTSILPYFGLSWLLLTAVLFIQQASRFSEVFFNVNIPAGLTWQLTLALLPNVIAFTSPVAILVGTVIGLTKMQGDSELVAIRASGVGNWQIAAPIIAVGILCSAFAFVMNLKGVPVAMAMVKRTALETAIKKLDSPLEPGVFNTELTGYTIYTDGGDIESGRWTDLFVYAEDAGRQQLRLITAKSGRIDTSGQASELVLERANVWTLPTAQDGEKTQAVAENLGDIRFAIKTKRAELIAQLERSDVIAEGLGLTQAAESGTVKDQVAALEAEIRSNRLILLSVTPLLFALVGTFIVLRFNRGGRGFGITLSLVVLMGFYLSTMAGEHLVRMGILGPKAGPLVPVAIGILTLLWLAYGQKVDLHRLLESLVVRGKRLIEHRHRIGAGDMFIDVTTGLRDFDLIRNLIKNSALTLCFLAALFVIFTALEMWRYVATVEQGAYLLGRYLVLLLPFVIVSMVPPAAMVGTLATFAIKSRQNELVTWASAGQSAYRLLALCLLVVLLAGAGNWVFQETVLPWANRAQEATRQVIKNRGAPVVADTRRWVKRGDRIYRFNSASDNEKASATCPGCVTGVRVFELDDNAVMRTVYQSDAGRWTNGRTELTGNIQRYDAVRGAIVPATASEAVLTEEHDPFAELPAKPSLLNTFALRRQLAAVGSDAERRAIGITLEKKYSTLFLPLVMVLFTAPLAISLGRRAKAGPIAVAVGLWLVFFSSTAVFEQFGLNGQLAPAVAVWTPLVVFSLLGVYLISRIRT